MCLLYNKEATQELRQRFANAKKDTLTFWKIYYVNKDEQVGYNQHANWLESPYQNHSIYSPGEIVSDRKSKSLHLRGEFPTTSISKGIHVYTSLKTAKKELKDFHKHNLLYAKLVKVEAKKKNLIGAGSQVSLYLLRDNQAVFMAVTITEKEWNKVFGV
jgi:hypothetical protein